MAIPMRKEEYRPAVTNVVGEALTDARFVAYLESLAEILLDGYTKPIEQEAAIRAFGILAKKRFEVLEQDLIEQCFDQKDY